MKKILLFIVAMFTMLNSIALTIPKGKIYYNNSLTKFDEVKFAYGDNVSKETFLVTMTNEGDDIWSYTFNNSISNVYRYIFCETELSAGVHKYTFTEFKDLIALDRGEIRTATTDKTIITDYIFVPIANENNNWYQGNWEKRNVNTNGCKPHSSTLPVIYLDTENNVEITSKEEYVNATFYITVPEGSEYEAVGSANEPIVTEIKGRGNYSWTGFDKKPYRLKMEKKASLLGMTKDKSYTLLAHADDTNAFLRNTIGFEMSRIVGLKYTPDQVPVELVLNGSYHGLYFLTDHLKVSSERVKITEQDDLETDPSLITGGWFLEIDNYNEPETQIHIPEKTYTDIFGRERTDMIWFTYKSPEELSDEQTEYITDFLIKTNAAIYSENLNSKEWEKYIDMDTLVNFYIVQEVMANGESFHGSCYMHKDRGADTKLIFGPVWDFGNSYRLGGEFIHANPPYGDIWIDQIYKYPRFQAAVKERWHSVRIGLLEKLEKTANEFISTIEAASECNYSRWPEYGNSDVQSGKINTLNYLKSRIEWLDSQWGTDPPTANVEDVAENIVMKVYPNPTTDKLFVDTSAKIIKANMFNLSGELVLKLDEKETEWDISLDSGTYLLVIETENSVNVNKIIVK